MRRSLTTLTMSMLVLLATAAPALAGAREEAGTRGSFGGVALALVLGAIFAGVIVAAAYRDTDFGDEDAHSDDVHAEDASAARDDSARDQQIEDEAHAPRP